MLEDCPVKILDTGNRTKYDLGIVQASLLSHHFLCEKAIVDSENSGIITCMRSQ